jgi:hypothetical protein
MKRDPLVIGITEVGKRELVVATLIRLERDLAARSSDRFDQLARRFLVLLRSIIHLEWTCAAKNE